MRLLIFLLLFISGSAYGQNEFQKLVGRWEGIQGSDTMIFLFEKDSTITMSNKNDKQVIGGKDSIRKGKKVRMIYSVDTSQQPFGLDLIIQETETKKEQGRMKGIFEFLSENQIKINLGPSNNRPTTFDQFSVTMNKKE